MNLSSLVAVGAHSKAEDNIDTVYLAHVSEKNEEPRSSVFAAQFSSREERLEIIIYHSQLVTRSALAADCVALRASCQCTENDDNRILPQLGIEYDTLYIISEQRYVHLVNAYKRIVKGPNTFEFDASSTDHPPSQHLRHFAPALSFISSYHFERTWETALLARIYYF